MGRKKQRKAKSGGQGGNRSTSAKMFKSLNSKECIEFTAQQREVFAGMEF